MLEATIRGSWQAPASCCIAGSTALQKYDVWGDAARILILRGGGGPRHEALYSPEEVLALMAAAEGFPSPLRQATLSTLVGLLYVTGMRVGEAIRLDRDDVDLTGRVLVVRSSKFGKSRELPVHESTAAALGGYAKRRDALCPHTRSPAFFVSLAGTRLLYCNVHSAFLWLVGAAGLTPRSATCRPRPHDYAEVALQSGVHPKVVSERLGHANIAITLDTYSHVLPSLDAAAADTVAVAILGP